MSGTDAIVRTHPVNTFSDYQFAITFAQQGGIGGGWLFARRKESEAWETAGGQVGPNEAMIDCAKRGLEEIGAVKYYVNPAFDYEVLKGDEVYHGQVFYAYVVTLHELPPESKVEEVKTFQAIPDKLTEPEVIAEIYDSLEKWLGLKGKHEYWDVYDENRQHTGRIHQRGVPMEKGDYHFVVRAWIVNSKGEFLITRRAFNKISYPGMWESPTGSVTCGEDSFTAVLREIQEETGIILYPERGELFTSYIQANAFFDNWLFRQEFDLASVILQENETIDARKATWNEISEMIARGEFMGRDVFQEFDMLKGIAGL